MKRVDWSEFPTTLAERFDPHYYLFAQPHKHNDDDMVMCLALSQEDQLAAKGGTVRPLLTDASLEALDSGQLVSTRPPWCLELSCVLSAWM